MSEERLITVPQNARVFCIPQEYLAICTRERKRKQKDGSEIVYIETDECAAAILRIIERWTVWKLKTYQLEKTGQLPWVYMNQADLREWELISAYGEYRITQALKLLVEHGFLNTRNNPKNSWDRTLQYQFNKARIQEDVGKLPAFRNIEEWRAQYREMDTAILGDRDRNITEAIPQIPEQDDLADTPSGDPPIVPIKKRKPKPRDPLFDVVAEFSFKVPVGAIVDKSVASSVGAIKRAVLTTYPDMTADTLRLIYQWNAPYASPQPSGVIAMIGRYKDHQPRHLLTKPTPLPQPPEDISCDSSAFIPQAERRAS